MPKAPKLGRFFRNAVKLGATSNDISNDLIADTTTIAQEDRMAKIAVLLVWLDESNAHHLSTTRTGRRTHWLRRIGLHSRAPVLYRREHDWSLSHRRLGSGPLPMIGETYAYLGHNASLNSDYRPAPLSSSAWPL
jgi:hypothetical protein